MGALRKLLAGVLAVISLALAFHFVAGEIYGGYLSQPDLVWDYLNWLTALGIVVTLVHHFQRKRAFDRQHQEDDVSVGYLSTNLWLFVAMFLALWFFANWFEELNSNGNASGTVVGFIWIAFNASFVVLGSVTAWQLWNEGNDANPTPRVPPGESSDESGPNAGIAMEDRGGAQAS